MPTTPPTLVETPSFTRPPLAPKRRSTSEEDDALGTTQCSAVSITLHGSVSAASAVAETAAVTGTARPRLAPTYLPGPIRWVVQRALFDMLLTGDGFTTVLRKIVTLVGALVSPFFALVLLSTYAPRFGEFAPTFVVLLGVAVAASFLGAYCVTRALKAVPDPLFFATLTVLGVCLEMLFVTAPQLPYDLLFCFWLCLLAVVSVPRIAVWIIFSTPVVAFNAYNRAAAPSGTEGAVYLPDTLGPDFTTRLIIHEATAVLALILALLIHQVQCESQRQMSRMRRAAVVGTVVGRELANYNIERARDILALADRGDAGALLDSSMDDFELPNLPPGIDAETAKAVAGADPGQLALFGVLTANLQQYRPHLPNWVLAEATQRTQRNLGDASPYSVSASPYASSAGSGGRAHGAAGGGDGLQKSVSLSSAGSDDFTRDTSDRRSSTAGGSSTPGSRKGSMSPLHRPVSHRRKSRIQTLQKRFSFADFCNAEGSDGGSTPKARSAVGTLHDEMAKTAAFENVSHQAVLQASLSASARLTSAAARTCTLRRVPIVRAVVHYVARPRGGRQVLSEALDALVDEVHDAARASRAAVHSFVGDAVAITWNAASGVGAPATKAVTFLARMRRFASSPALLHEGRPLLGLGGAATLCEARVALGGTGMSQALVVASTEPRAGAALEAMGHFGRAFGGFVVDERTIRGMIGVNAQPVALLQLPLLRRSFNGMTPHPLPVSASETGGDSAVRRQSGAMGLLLPDEPVPHPLLGGADGSAAGDGDALPDEELTQELATFATGDFIAAPPPPPPGVPEHDDTSSHSHSPRAPSPNGRQVSCFAASGKNNADSPRQAARRKSSHFGASYSMAGGGAAADTVHTVTVYEVLGDTERDGAANMFAMSPSAQSPAAAVSSAFHLALEGNYSLAANKVRPENVAIPDHTIAARFLVPRIAQLASTEGATADDLPVAEANFRCCIAR